MTAVNRRFVQISFVLRWLCGSRRASRSGSQPRSRNILQAPESSADAWTYINHRHPHASLDDGVVPIGSNVGHLRASANPEQLLAAAPRSRVEGHRPAAAGIEPVAARIEREVARSSTTGKVRPRKEPEHHSLYPHRPLHDLVPKPRQGRQTARVTCNSSSDFQGYGTRHA